MDEKPIGITEFSLRHNKTGEVFDVQTKTEYREQYSIRRLRMNVWIDGYEWVQEKTCHSALDIKILRNIKSDLDTDNQAVFSMVNMAEEIGTTRNKISVLVKRLVNVGFLAKKATNVYIVNPYVFIGNRVSNVNKKHISNLQIRWSRLYGYPPETNELWESKTLLIDRTGEVCG